MTTEETDRFPESFQITQVVGTVVLLDHIGEFAPVVALRMILGVDSPGTYVFDDGIYAYEITIAQSQHTPTPKVKR